MSKRRRSGKRAKATGWRPPIVKGEKPPRRNDPCPCGSGMKWKKCHGAPSSPENRPKSIYTTLRSQYTEAQQGAEARFIEQWGFMPNPSQLMTFMEGTAQEMKDVVLIGLKRLNAGPEYLYTVDKLGCLLTSKNIARYSKGQQKLWDTTLEEYRQAHPPEEEETEDAAEPEPTGSA